jgi:hypothetical protein
MTNADVTDQPPSQAADPALAKGDWLVRVNNQEFRAPDWATLQQWSKEGRVPPTAHIWNPIYPDWRQAREIGLYSPPPTASPAYTAHQFHSGMNMPIIVPQQHGTQHMIPKCLRCGTVTPWRAEPIMLAHHWVIFLILLLVFGAGLIYLLVVLLIRSNEANRAKICPYCAARNLWTFIYEDEPRLQVAGAASQATVFASSSPGAQL